jgi:hypothetical protein
VGRWRIITGCTLIAVVALVASSSVLGADGTERLLATSIGSAPPVGPNDLPSVKPVIRINGVPSFGTLTRLYGRLTFDSTETVEVGVEIKCPAGRVLWDETIGMFESGQTIEIKKPPRAECGIEVDSGLPGDAATPKIELQVFGVYSAGAAPSDQQAQQAIVVSVVTAAVHQQIECFKVNASLSKNGRWARATVVNLTAGGCGGYPSAGPFLLKKTSSWRIVWRGSKFPPCSLGVSADLARCRRG